MSTSKKVVLAIGILLLNSLDGLSQQCSTCNASGWTTTIPSQTTKSYSVPTLPGAEYLWIASGGLEILSGNGTNTVSIKPNSSGQLCITRYKSGTNACADCAQITVVPPPNTPTSLTIITNNCVSVAGTVNAVPGAASYKWYVDNSFVGSTTSTMKTINFSAFPGFAQGSHTLCVEALNQFSVPSAGKFCKPFTGCTPPAPSSLSIVFDECVTLTATIPYLPQASSYNWYVDGVFFRNTLQVSGRSNAMVVNLVDYPELVTGGAKGAVSHDLCVETVDAFGVVSSTRRCETFARRCEPETPTIGSAVVQSCQSIVVNATTESMNHNFYIDGVLYSTMQTTGKTITITIPLSSNPNLASGQHTFCLEAVNAFGASNQSCKTISINCGGPPLPVAIPEIFSVFPNPGSSDITIKSSVIGSYTIELIDQAGNKIRSVQSSDSETTLSNIDPGRYYVQIVFDGRTTTRQILIEP